MLLLPARSALALALFVLPVGPAPDPAGEVSTIADAYLRARFAAFPEFATQLGVPGARHDRLRDRSTAAERTWSKQEDALLARLHRVDRRAL
jgi:uncharacterized protein (DUF885 family)